MAKTTKEKETPKKKNEEKYYTVCGGVKAHKPMKKIEKASKK